MSSNYRTRPALKEWLDWLRPKVPSWPFRPAVWGVCYAVVGLFTFGHVASDNWRADQYEYEQCDRSRQANGRHSYNRCDRPETVLIAPKGLAAGALWPLYLSWEVQQ